MPDQFEQGTLAMYRANLSLQVDRSKCKVRVQRRPVAYSNRVSNPCVQQDSHRRETHKCENNVRTTDISKHVKQHMVVYSLFAYEVICSTTPRETKEQVCVCLCVCVRVCAHLALISLSSHSHLTLISLWSRSHLALISFSSHCHLTLISLSSYSYLSLWLVPSFSGGWCW
jgi:hypothetical protein